MAYHLDGYYYDSQLRSYCLQFMAIFTDLQVKIGMRNDVEPELISVPIHYALPDRVAIAVNAGNTQNKPLRVPVMSAYLRNVQFDQSVAHGTGVTRRNAFLPQGGLLPNDIKVVHQRMPLPIIMNMELNLFASNNDQHFQMLEQILPLFEPDLNIQTSDAMFDMARISTVRLTSSQFDTPYPVGTDRRTIQSTHLFEVRGWISMPADVRNDFVNKIFLRIGAVSTGAVTNEEMIAELDAAGFTYDLVKDGNDIDIGDRPTIPS